MTRKTNTKADRKTAISVAAITAAGGIIVAGIYVVPKLFPRGNGDAPTPDERGKTEVSIPGELSGSPVITGDANVVTVTEDSEAARILEGSLPETHYIHVDLGRHIAEQIQLYPEDEVEIMGGQCQLEEVWFGESWQAYERGKTYVVVGIRGSSVVPKFKGIGTFKARVSYRKHRDKRRDPRPPDAPEPAA